MPRPAIVPHVLEQLAHEVVSGRFPPGGRLPPTRELADQLHVARKTLLAALRLGQQHAMVRMVPRQGTLLTSDAVARARAYLESRAVGRRATKLAILVPDQHLPMKDPFYLGLVREIVRESRRRGIEAAVQALPTRDQDHADASLAREGFGAAICLAFAPTHLPALVLLLERHFPVMAFNRRLPSVNVPSVCIDDDGTTRRIVELLVGLGHRDLCMVSGILCASPWSGTRRIQGWAEALAERGLFETCCHPIYIVPPIRNISSFIPAFADLMRQAMRPTAMVFCGAHSAREFLTDPRFNHLRVPEDVSVVVLQPGPEALDVDGRPDLTTARLDERRAAQCCVEMAEKLLAGHLHPPSIRVAATIALTESVGPPPASVATPR